MLFATFSRLTSYLWSIQAAQNIAFLMNLKTAVERGLPFDTPALRTTQGERPITELVSAPFVLSAFDPFVPSRRSRIEGSKVYRSKSRVATAEFRMKQLSE
jgi:hypothetical protein